MLNPNSHCSWVIKQKTGFNLLLSPKKIGSFGSRPNLNLIIHYQNNRRVLSAASDLLEISGSHQNSVGKDLLNFSDGDDVKVSSLEEDLEEISGPHQNSVGKDLLNFSVGNDVKISSLEEGLEEISGSHQNSVRKDLLNFSVGNDVEISSSEEGLEQISGSSHSNSVGKKYLLNFTNGDHMKINSSAENSEEISGSHSNSAGKDFLNYSNGNHMKISSSEEGLEEDSGSHSNSVANNLLNFSNGDHIKINSSAERLEEGKDYLMFSDDEVKISLKSEDESEDNVNGNLSRFSGEKKARRLNVKALAQSLWDCSTTDDIEHVIGKIVDIHPSVYSSMIKGLGIDKKLNSAIALVDWLKTKREENESSLPNVITYNSLLGAVRLSGEYSKAEEIIKEMEEIGIPPNVISYNTMMLIHIDQGKYDQAIELIEIMKSKGISPSAATFSTALLAYQTAGDAIGALDFFSKLRERLERNGDKDWEFEFEKLKNFTIRICFQVIRNWLVNEEINNPTSMILELLSEMDRAGVAGGRPELEKLAWACTRESHSAVGKEIYRRIRNLESGVSLSVCNHIIWLMGKAKKWWAALEIYEDLLDQGPKPNNLSYELIVSHFNVLLSAARKRGLWRWGLRLLNKMQDKGLKPGSKEWNSVLIACSKASETSSAIQIFKTMIECGEKPTIVSYGALLSALEKGELYDEALRVWDHMCKMGIEPNLHAYTILISIYIGSGRAELVESTIRDMISSGVHPTVVTFNAIISVCARKNQGSAAYEWFHRMKIRNIMPNEITYEMLIEALARDGKPRLAFEIYVRAFNEGIQLSGKAYDAVMRSCQLYGASIDVEMLGPRPSRPNHLPRRDQPFVRETCTL